jgi:NAD(P)H-flavin reductase
MTVTLSGLTPKPMQIMHRSQETADVFTLELAPEGAFLFAPGQFNMLYLPGLGEVAISISGDSSEPKRLVHTIRVVGRVTRELARLEVGAFVGVRGPFGKGWPIEEALHQDIVIVAGGLGLAPLRPLILEVVRRRPFFRKVAILVGARTPEDLLFQTALETWARADIQVLLTVDQATQSWHGQVGVVPPLLREVDFDPANATVFTCGPEIMMRFAQRELSRLGVPDHRFQVSLERSMKCGVGLCGHCQLGPFFLCKDGPVLSFDRVSPFLLVRGA